MADIYRGSSIELPVEDLKEFLTTNKVESFLLEDIEEGKFDRRFGRDITLYLFQLPKDCIPALIPFIESKEYSNKNSMLHKVKQYNNILKSFKSKAPKQLQDLVSSLKLLIEERAYKFCLTEEKENNSFRLYRARNIDYSPYDARTESPATVTVTLSYSELGEKRTASIAIQSDDLTGTVEEILIKKGYSFTTKEQYEAYLFNLKRYQQIATNIGAQFVLKEKQKIYTELDSDVQEDRYYSRRSYQTYRPGARFVVDTNEDTKVGTILESITFFTQDQREGTVTLPMVDSLMVHVFSLDVHGTLNVDSTLLEPYKYKDDIYEDLVIPEKTKNCLDILLRSDSYKFDDIVDNKSGGVVVLSSGPAGCGKTLTAQVYAELIHKPLYSVQSSQLGLDTQNIEKNLRKVLNRASRWKATLLIDEADVFIRQRGDDLHQNAIVGVFLRVLETFEGVLFFTTNRFLDNKGEQFVDDAILSRCTAHIRYELPSQESVSEILEIQCDKLGLSLTEENKKAIIDELSDYQISGRDIRNVVKLSKLFASRSGSSELTLNVVKSVIPFHSTIQKK
jgi:hypothetical protein